MFEPGDRISTQEQSLYVLWDKGQIPTIPKPSLQRIRLQDALESRCHDPLTGTDYRPPETFGD